MSRIGTLEQLDVSSVLQGIERSTRTGLFVVKQGVQWVEFYFREGRLMCVGPVRAHATLGDRLLSDGVISVSILQETLQVIGDAPASEMRIALTLMDLGYIGHEALRNWAEGCAKEAIFTILSWPQGEIYFEENVIPPADRLPVALSVGTLLGDTPVQTPSAIVVPQASIQENLPSQQANHVSRVANAPTLVEPEQFFSEEKLSAASLFSADALIPVFGLAERIEATDSMALIPSLPVALQSTPTSVSTSLVMQPVNISFMLPDMLLFPADLSGLREQNPQIQLTPNQWRLLTKVDGKTTLLAACQELGLSADQLCAVAGELMGLGVIHVGFSLQQAQREFSPVQLVQSSPVQPFAASNEHHVQPFAPLPQTSLPAMPDALPQYELSQASQASAFPFETQSQWGNGGNGATFVPGRGWVVSPQPLQPLPVQRPLSASGAYASISGH